MTLDDKTILIVDDNADNLFILESDLKGLGYSVCQADHAEAAMRFVEERPFCLIILDVDMPGESGFELYTRIRQIPHCEDTPVLFLSGVRVRQKDIIEGLRYGAFDYITKPYELDAFECRIRLLIELYNRGRQLKAKNHQLVELAIKDSLTGLYNRRYGIEALQNEMHRHARYGGFLSVLLVDLDDFKNINDRFGHNAGDEALIYVSRLLTKCIRETDISFRAGGDEFIVILPNANHVACEQICHRIFNNLAPIYLKNGVSVTIGLSIGGAVFESPQNDVNYLTEMADIALLNAKSSGKNRFKVLGEENIVDHAHASLMNISEVRSSIKIVLVNTMQEILNEFEITNNVVNGHTELMIEILQKVCPALNLCKHDETVLMNAIKLRRFEHLSVSKELLTSVGPLTLDQKTVLAEALLENMQKLRKISFFDEETEVLLHHHEYYDGSGYPYGKSGNEIPYLSRLLAVVEAFVLLALGGPHTEQNGFQNAIQLLRQEAQTHFDPELVAFFEKFIAENEAFKRGSNRFSILVIDDQIEIANSIRHYLNFYGFENVIVKDTREGALSYLQHKEVDLVISDISLPGTDKLSFLDEMRQAQESVPLIVVSSGYATLAWSQKEKYQIAHAFRKPVSLHHLYKVTKDILRIKEKPISVDKESI